jgi:glycosyltransferase involved in cell wall biosynthesis
MLRVVQTIQRALAARSRRTTAVKLSVIIPTLNEENHVGSLLSDIARQTRKAGEVIVVDGESEDGTVSVAKGFAGVKLLSRAPSVSGQRNLGGRSASGDVLIFLDTDVRLPATFFEDFLRSFEEKRLDVACALYMPPPRSTLTVKVIHIVLNGIFVAVQKVLASGSGQCVAIRREAFQGSEGFDTCLTFADNIELIWRLSREHRFGVVLERVFVSDRRFKKYGVSRVLGKLLLLSLLFTIGRFDWANHIEYEFGDHESPPALDSREASRRPE